MTGEITLRGKVLPIGGVKEKLLAAHRAGLTNIILPKDNEKDLADIPKNVLDTMNVHLVETMDEVLREALAGSAAGCDSPARRDRPRRDWDAALEIHLGSRFTVFRKTTPEVLCRSHGLQTRLRPACRRSLRPISSPMADSAQPTSNLERVASTRFTRLQPI